MCGWKKEKQMYSGTMGIKQMLRRSDTIIWGDRPGFITNWLASIFHCNSDIWLWGRKCTPKLAEI